MTQNINNCGICLSKMDGNLSMDNRCDVCWTQIHMKCMDKYCCDITNQTNCYECGGSIIKTFCCNTKVSLNYLSGQMIELWNIPNDCEDYTLLKKISNTNTNTNINSDTNTTDDVYLLLNNFENKYNNEKIIESPEFILDEKTKTKICCVHCVYNKKAFLEQKYSNIQFDKIKNYFEPKLTDEIITLFTNLPHRD